MYKNPKNPKIAGITSSWNKRRFNLSDLDVVRSPEGLLCVWCLEPLTGRKYKWCSEKCSESAYAWSSPQKEGGLHVLLVRQDFKCAGCLYDYIPFVEDTLKYMNRKSSFCDPSTITAKINIRFAKLLKYKVPTDRHPNVDHLIPIAKGGQSLGFDNVQILCFTCHKIKTKIDNSGPRRKKNVT